MNGREALGIVKIYGRSLDLIVTDMVMPEMNAREFVDSIKDDYPNVKVLFMSGYSERSFSELNLDVETYLLPKPFTPHTLAQKVADLLGQNVALEACLLNRRQPLAQVCRKIFSSSRDVNRPTQLVPFSKPFRDLDFAGRHETSLPLERHSITGPPLHCGDRFVQILRDGLPGRQLI